MKKIDNYRQTLALGFAFFIGCLTMYSLMSLHLHQGNQEEIVVVSDKNKKENFKPEMAEDVLKKVVTLSVTSWNYKNENKSLRHIGPMAQEFHAAFKLGKSDTTIHLMDANGVNLLAIQALARRTEELKRSKLELSKANAELSLRLNLVEARLDRLEDTALSHNGGQKGKQ